MGVGILELPKDGRFWFFHALQIWVLNQKYGENLQIIDSNIGFSIINDPFWGTPIFGNIHIMMYVIVQYVRGSSRYVTCFCLLVGFCG